MDLLWIRRFPTGHHKSKKKNRSSDTVDTI